MEATRRGLARSKFYIVAFCGGVALTLGISWLASAVQYVPGAPPAVRAPTRHAQMSEEHGMPPGSMAMSSGQHSAAEEPADRPAATPTNDALPAPAGLTVRPDDRNAIVQWDFDPNAPVRPLPPGVMGYKITWGPASAPVSFSKLVEEPIVQLQPLVNGQAYQAYVQAVDDLGRLGPRSATVSFTGDSSRVDRLRQRMNGFFDDFNLPEGPPDELKWNAAYSRCNVDWSNGFFINNQFHAHNTAFSGVCDRAQSISRPRAALDFSDNGTRTIVFDFDGVSLRNKWYLDLVPRLMDINGHVNNEDPNSYMDPAGGLRFVQREQIVAIVRFNPDGSETILAGTGGPDFPTLEYAGLQLTSNVRRHWEIHVSRDYADIYIDGQKVVATAPGAFNLPLNQYHLLWNLFSYNTNKANQPFVLAHWDNFGFDAPSRTRHNVVTHNYKVVNNGLDFIKAFAGGSPATVRLNIPDAVAGAVGQRLMFTLQEDPYDTYVWDPSDKVSVNGVDIPIPEPSTDAIPPLPMNKLVGVAEPYSMVIPLPVGALRQGQNTLVFTTVGSSLLNIHAELDFDAATAPPYTQPDLGASMPKMPAIGPNAIITQVGDTRLETWADYLNDASRFNPTVSGVVPVSIEVHNDRALRGTGSNPGVIQVDLLVDRKVMLSQRTDAQVPAPAIKYTFYLNTRWLANGVHEIYLRAYGPKMVPSIADYGGAGGQSGRYYPIHITVRNDSVPLIPAPYRYAMWLMWARGT